ALLYMVGIRGNHIAPHDQYRINYNTQLFSFPTKFWGIGYENAARSSYETDYKEFRVKLSGEFLYRFGAHLYAGPSAEFSYIRAKNVDPGSLWLWEGEALSTTNTGVGIAAAFDTRDNMTAPTSGWYIRAEQKFYPRFLGNGRYNFSMTEIGINKYTRLWRGGILAGRLHCATTYGHTPWGMLPTVGGSYTMRGYYEARFRDKTAADLTLELRQHVWRRSGIAVWVGVGTVEPRFSAIRLKNLLPNAGIGYRWEFKQHTNVRLDFGIGRGTTGFVFNINEAF
ncbi:MAG: BamA/TamA family outer membrane protein, partial [Duncaniella sp.]|nr:BamA/TamA family outer membrane protein [Duncaniella sp.]